MTPQDKAAAEYAERELFEKIESLGECIQGDIHIIDVSDSTFEYERKYRVYHKNGYCFDIEKAIDVHNQESGEIESFEYCLYDEWDGFEKLDAKGYLNLFNL